MTKWFEAKEGRVENCHDLSDEFGEGAFLWAEHPDWVRYPPELGGGQGRVVHSTTLTFVCQTCSSSLPKKALFTEHGFGVFGCEECKKFFWFKMQNHT